MRKVSKIIVPLTIMIGTLITACQNKSSSEVQNLEMKVQNLESFARLYGYARWFHPSDEAQEINWSRFAVLGVQKVENIKSAKELRDTLYRLFSPIVQGLQIYDEQKPEIFNPDILLSPDPNAKPVAWQHYGVYLNEQSKFYKSIRTNKNEVDKKYSLEVYNTGKLFDRMPQFGEATNASIGNNLICVVPLTLLSNDTSTYPKTDASTLNRLQSELDNMSDYRYGFYPEANLASIIIAWNVLQHFFPYFDVIDVDWNNVLGETLKNTIGNQSKKDFFVTLSEMFAKIEDGHGIVFGEQMSYLPIRSEFVENEIVITASHDTSLKRGDIIKKIDGKSVMEALVEKEKIISGSPQLRRYRALNILGSKPEPRKSYFVIDRDGIEQNIAVLNSSPGSMFFNPIDDRKYKSETIVEIEPGIFYINTTKCTNSKFKQYIDVLANAKAVIYDERGGNQLDLLEIIPFWIEEPVSSTWWNIPQTVYPDRKEVEFSKSNWDIQPQKPLFKSKSVIINESSVVSGGETQMGIIDHYHLATTVGEVTAGCNGNFNSIYLPCGYYAWFTGMKVLKHDDSQLYLKGFEPDYPVSKTIQAIKEGRDEYLEKALEVARQQ